MTGEAAANNNTTLPPVTDPLTVPFWDAAGQGRLVIQRCLGCGELRWPPLVGCPECHSRDATWDEVRPTGTIWSFVVYHRAFAAELRDEIPYTVAMVQLDDGPYLVGRLEDAEHADRPPAIGDRVTAVFTETGGVPSVRWRAGNTERAGNTTNGDNGNGKA
jgi:uncharacterized OB-fold protein